MDLPLFVNIESIPSHFGVYWTRTQNGVVEIIRSGAIGTNGGNLSFPSLTIQKPTIADNGIYVCHAQNVVGMGKSENISLHIEGGKSFIKLKKLHEHNIFGKMKRPYKKTKLNLIVVHQNISVSSICEKRHHELTTRSDKHINGGF